MLRQFTIGDRQLMLTEPPPETESLRLHWLQGHTLSFGKTISYWPFLEMLRGAAGITEVDTPASSWDKLAHWASNLLHAEAEDLLPYLALLLALDVAEAQEARVQTLSSDSLGPHVLRAMRRLVTALAVERPTVLAVEDVQWLDGSSSDLLEHLLPIGERLPFLVIVTARSDPDTPATRLRQIGQLHMDRFRELSLGPLGDEDSAQLVAHLLDTDSVPERVHALIRRKAEGNPLFLEEVVRALTEQQSLVRNSASGAWQSVESPVDPAIPDTIQGVLQARLDRLDPEVRDVLRIASVIGRTFFHRVLSAVADAGRALDGRLEMLQNLDFIREQRRLPELEYLFKHALIQETAYASMLLRRRRELHRLVGTAIESLFADQLEEFYGVLAYHYGRAEEWEKAREYLLKAGDQAGRLAADSEALAHYQQAFEIHARIFGDRWDPLERAALERKMGEALFRRGDYQAARSSFKRALDYVGGDYPGSGRRLRLTMLMQAARQASHRITPWLVGRPFRTSRNRAADEERACVYERMMWMELLVDLERSGAIALLLLNDAEAGGVAYGIALGSTALGVICDTVGAFGWAEAYHRRALAAASLTRQQRVLANAYFGMAYHQQYIGNWKQALEGYQQAAGILWQSGELRLWATTRIWATFLTCWRGDISTAAAQIEEVVQATRDGGDRVAQALAEGFLGYLRTLSGDLDGGMRAQESALEFLDRVPDYQGATGLRGTLARCYLRQGALHQAQEVIDAALSCIVRHRVRGATCTAVVLAEAEASVLRAELVANGDRQATLDQAQRACRRAIAGGKLDSAGLPGAYRAAGACEWLRGKPAAARELWQRSLDAAERLGARYETGLTLLEMGRRRGEQSALEQAEVLLAACGADLDRRRAHELLARPHLRD